MSDLSKSNKFILTKFVISSHMLNIKRGRYTRPKQHEHIDYAIVVME